MPIYEFYCPDCHTVFSFFTARPRPRVRPDCPRCDRARIERRPSTFAYHRGGGRADEEDSLLEGLDESRLESAMESLAGEMEGIEESEDPMVLGRAFRRFGELTGLELGPRMEEAIQRMESGEDLDAVEADLGPEDDDNLEDYFRLKRSLSRRLRRPAVDETLYFL